jgi:uncharacterized protein (DUF2336 family)
MGEHLTQADVARLVGDKPMSARVNAAAKLGAQLDSRKLSIKERRMAEGILRVMIRDAEAKVRQALSEALKYCTEVPRDVVLAIIHDNDLVAAPMLAASELLSDEDLIEIVRSQNKVKCLAVVRRDTVSTAVADALIETGDDEVVARLSANNGANISEPALQSILDHYADSDRIKGALIDRATLPVVIAERLVNLVSEQLRERLVTRHELSSDTASELVQDIRERAVSNMLSERGAGSDLDKLIRQLNNNGRLTPSLILRRLCMADHAFFTIAIAHRAKISQASAQSLIFGGNSGGVFSLMNAAKMPQPMFGLIRTAIAVIKDLSDSASRDFRRQFSDGLLMRLQTCYVTEPIDDLDYVVTRLVKFTRHKN